MLNVYEQVSANKNKSAAIIGLFIAFFIGTAYLITATLDLDPSLLLIASSFSLISAVGSFFLGDKIILSLNGAHPASRDQFFDFYTVTENLSLSKQIPVPKLFVIDSPAPNAFATGRDPQHAVICATTGLLQKLNRTQIEAVVAHEISHILNYDIRLMTLVSILVGSLSILSDIILRNRFHRHSDRDNKNAGPLAIVGFILIIFSPLIAKLIQLAISRRREFLADASAVKTTRQPSGLIEALQIISSDSSQLSSASPATAPLYISNPFKGQKFAALFSTHPPLADRIKALQSML